MQSVRHRRKLNGLKTNAARGARGAQLILAPADYLRATSATLGPIASSM